MYSQSKRKQQKSLINRQCYKEFVGFGFGPRALPMGRGKIERETKGEKKKDFCLEGTQEGGEQQQGLPQKRKERAAKKESCAWRIKQK